MQDYRHIRALLKRFGFGEIAAHEMVGDARANLGKAREFIGVAFSERWV